MSDLAFGIVIGFTLGIVVALVVSGAWRELRPRDRADLRRLQEYSIAMERLSSTRRRPRPSQRSAHANRRYWT